jgi:hypothetical protein
MQWKSSRTTFTGLLALLLLLLLLLPGMDEQGTISQASVEAAIQQMSGAGGHRGPQHVTVIDAFKVRGAVEKLADAALNLQGFRLGTLQNCP